MFFNASISSCLMRFFSFFFLSFFVSYRTTSDLECLFLRSTGAKDNSLKEAADGRLCRTYGDKIK